MTNVMRPLFSFIRFIFRLSDFCRRKVNIWFAERSGLDIGEKTILVGIQSFGTEPYLIRIGKSCLITNNVTFITHDGSIQVPLIRAGEDIGDVYSVKSTFSPIEIGDNVFIGVGSIILPGSKVANNSIVAAGSVVKGVFRAGVVIAGNPAREVCELQEYYLRNANRIIDFRKTNMTRKNSIQSLCKFTSDD